MYGKNEASYKIKMHGTLLIDIFETLSITMCTSSDAAMLIYCY